MNNYVIKRDGTRVPFDKSKIVQAISKANKEVLDNEKISLKEMKTIAKEIEAFNDNGFEIEEIQDYVERKLMERGYFELAKKYVLYRNTRLEEREQELSENTYKEVVDLLFDTNVDIEEENSNKDAKIFSTQRDLTAGIISADLTFRHLLDEDIVAAHQNGEIHFHDKDYFMQKGMFNCCLINLKDMLMNGTVMNDKLVERPKSFQVACTVTTQIIATVASHQYGGQSINVADLSYFLKYSEEKHYNKMLKIVNDEKLAKQIASEITQKELESGIQTIQYQINTLMTTNGQSPFVTMFLELREDDPYIEYTERIIEEVIKQRIQGIKNEYGVYVTPAFPKLVYVLDENNVREGTEYFHITKLCAKCTSKRMYPDYISRKIMDEYYGDTFAPMGCRSFLAPYKDKETGENLWYGRFNQGVVSLNLPQIGILADGDEDVFWRTLDDRLDIAKKALMARHEQLKGTKAKVSPIHWQYGAIARLSADDVIDPYLYDGYSTISLGYIGLQEMCVAMFNKPITDQESSEFAHRVMDKLNESVNKWKEEENIGFSLYGTPAESLCYRFARIDKERFGVIKGVTDNDFYTNSFHVHVAEEIDAFSKLEFESSFQEKSLGGAISYIEVPYMYNNLEAVLSVMEFMYDNIRYAEFNSKSDHCNDCGFSGEILLDSDHNWYCPKCGNKNKDTLYVTRRTCGYLGSNFWNKGKTKEMSQRYCHL